MNAIETALYATLTGSTAVTDLLAGSTSVYNHVAPQGAVPPFVVFSHQAGVPVHTFAGVAYEDTSYLVKAVTTGPSMRVAGEIRDAVDGVLADSTLGSVAGYGVLYVRRAGEVSYTETVDGQRYNHRGSTYRVLVDPST